MLRCWEVDAWAIHGLPELRGNPIIPGKPKGRPAGLPPPLVDSLSLENITSAWKAATPMGRICPGMGVASVSDRCPFSWFSGLSKQGQNETYARDLFSTNNAYVEENTGWDINTAGKKLGISPTAKTKQALLKFNFEGTKVTRITFFYMKSYGEQWENSTIALTVMAMTNGSEFELLKRDELGGVHEKYTSETYTHSIDLMASSSSSSSMMLRNGKVTTVQVTIQHLRGQTFKIMGLAICEWKPNHATGCVETDQMTTDLIHNQSIEAIHVVSKKFRVLLWSSLLSRAVASFLLILKAYWKSYYFTNAAVALTLACCSVSRAEHLY